MLSQEVRAVNAEIHILDTDHFSLLQRLASAEAQPLRFRLESIDDDERLGAVITLNLEDFGKVPGLKVEDWSA